MLALVKIIVRLRTVINYVPVGRFIYQTRIYRDGLPEIFINGEEMFP